MNKCEAFIRKYAIVLDYIILVLCAYLVVNTMIGHSTILAVYRFLKQEVIYNILLVLAAIKLYMCFRLSDKETVFAAVFLALSIIFKQAGLTDVTYLVIPMVALYGVNFKVVAEVFASSAVFCLIIILITALMGGIQNETMERQDSIRGVAYNLGFEHHSWFMMYWLFAVFAIIYIFKGKKIRMVISMVLLILSVVLWLITDSRTSGIIAALVCAIMIINDLFHIVIKSLHRSYTPAMRGFQRGLLKLTPIVPLVAVLLTFLGCVYFGHFGYKILPPALLSRFNLADAALEALGVKLPFSVTEDRWDMPFNWITGAGQEISIEGYNIDNVYAKLLIENGYITLIPYVMLQMFVRYKLYQKRQYVLALICASVSIFGILESRAFTTFACALFSMLLFTRIPVKKRARRTPTRNNNRIR